MCPKAADDGSSTRTPASLAGDLDVALGSWLGLVWFALVSAVVGIWKVNQQI